MTSLCRDCLSLSTQSGRCSACGSPRVVTHGELRGLSIAHVDCDAFYAAVEKRDNPDLADKPVIIGGGKRGVVSTACYVARIRGVRSAMPMFKALALCPDAVVISPRMSVYVEASQAIRDRMLALTPSVEPLSLDEAFLDLAGTERLHGAPPAVLLARLVRDIERDVGISASVGLSHSKFLAKIASDLDKPRGFSVIGKDETKEFLAAQDIGVIWGVGRSFRDTLARDGIRSIADLLTRDRKHLADRYGAMGDRLWNLARGIDRRRVSNRSGAKSISHETTFFEDTGSADILDGHLWRLAVKVSDRAKAKDIAGRVVTVKLKRASHALLTRRISLPQPTQRATVVYEAAASLLRAELPAAPFRLIGVGLSDLCPAEQADLTEDLLDGKGRKNAATEAATDAIRKRFGSDAIVKGRALR